MTHDIADELAATTIMLTEAVNETRRLRAGIQKAIVTIGSGYPSMAALNLHALLEPTP